MRLGVNIDHVATIRQARRANEPEPVAAALIAELARNALTNNFRRIDPADARVLLFDGGGFGGSAGVMGRHDGVAGLVGRHGHFAQAAAAGPIDAVVQGLILKWEASQLVRRKNQRGASHHKHDKREDISKRSHR